MNDILSFLRSIGVARLGAIIGVSMGVAAALALIIARIGAPPMTVLFADLDLSAASAVSARLEQEGVPFEIREQGGRAAILAPRAEAGHLRIALAGDGVVDMSGVGYEIFDKEDAFGATSFQQSINRLRALEGELARTIASIEGVRGARVHLVLPERELFARDERAASASIVIDAPSGLDRKSVRAIVNLVAGAAPGLSASRVTVLDSSGALLASGETDETLAAGAVEERIAATEGRLRRTVEDLVGRIVGADNLRVEVAAEMDFNRVVENAEIIDPDSQTVLSSTTIEEAADDVDPAIGRGVTVANALPGATTTTDAGGASTSSNRRTEETTNYEISRTVRSETREQGAVKRLSVAVALNAGAAPRTAEDLARIDALVKSAIGFVEARGDRVEIVEVAFQPLASSAPGTSAAQQGLSREEMLRAGEIAALGLIALALVYFVLRPMLAGARTAGVPAASASPARAVAEARDAAYPESQTALPAPNRAFEAKIDLARVEGQVKASSLSKVSEVVKGHTDESAGILKGWIRQAS